MDLISFVYGIIFVVVITIVIVAIIGYFDGRKTRKKLEGLNAQVWREFEVLRSDLSREQLLTNEKIDNCEVNIHRTMDSRFNKLEDKLTKAGAFGIIPQKKSYSEELFSILAEDKVKDLMEIPKKNIVNEIRESLENNKSK